MINADLLYPNLAPPPLKQFVPVALSQGIQSLVLFHLAQPKCGIYHLVSESEVTLLNTFILARKKECLKDTQSCSH